MRTPIIITSLSLALLAPLAPALAQERLKTAALEGRFQVEVTRTTARRTFDAEAELDVSGNGRIRLRIGGRRVRLARVGDTLYGRLPVTPAGLTGGLSGGQGLPAATITLRIRSANELSGTVQSEREYTRVALRRAPTVDAAVVDAARRYVMANAGDEDAKAFPSVDSGEDGLHAYALAGAGAERLVAFTKAWFESDSDVAAYRFDAAREAIVAVRTTFDEEGLFVVVLDRASGAGRVLGDELHVVDTSYTLDQATLDRLVPGMGDIEDVDHMDLIDKLVDGGVEVDMTPEFFALRHWGAPAEPVRFFRDEADWRVWYDSNADLEGKWAYLQDDEVDHATFVLGRNDLWVEVVKVLRATGTIEVVGEH